MAAPYKARSKGPRHGKVREIDFRRPSKFAREQIRRMEHAHENFCRSASSRMSAELRSQLQLEVIGTDQLPYSTVMTEEVPPQALVTVLTIEPLGTEVALIMDLQLALTFVDRLLGGAGKPASTTATGLTEVEFAVARRALVSFVDQLSSTWIDLAETTFSITSMSTSPLGVQIVPPSEPTLLLNLSAMIEDQISIITLCLPHRSVEPIIHLFEQSHFAPAVTNGSEHEELRRSLSAVQVELRAEVGGVELSVERVLRLRPGDVVELGRPVRDGITLVVGDTPTYVAAPGRNGKARAAQVRAPWEEEE
jgi:flagellar motor switch protein FliM